MKDIHNIIRFIPINKDKLVSSFLDNNNMVFHDLIKKEYNNKQKILDALNEELTNYIKDVVSTIKTDNFKISDVIVNIHKYKNIDKRLIDYYLLEFDDSNNYQHKLLNKIINNPIFYKYFPNCIVVPNDDLFELTNYIINTHDDSLINIYNTMFNNYINSNLKSFTYNKIDISYEPVIKFSQICKNYVKLVQNLSYMKKHIEHNFNIILTDIINELLIQNNVNVIINFVKHFSTYLEKLKFINISYSNIEKNIPSFKNTKHDYFNVINSIVHVISLLNICIIDKTYIKSIILNMLNNYDSNFSDKSLEFNKYIDKLFVSYNKNVINKDILCVISNIIFLNFTTKDKFIEEYCNLMVERLLNNKYYYNDKEFIGVLNESHINTKKINKIFIDLNNSKDSNSNYQTCIINYDKYAPHENMNKNIFYNTTLSYSNAQLNNVDTIISNNYMNLPNQMRDYIYTYSVMYEQQYLSKKINWLLNRGILTYTINQYTVMCNPLQGIIIEQFTENIIDYNVLLKNDIFNKLPTKTKNVLVESLIIANIIKQYDGKLELTLSCNTAINIYEIFNKLINYDNEANIQISKTLTFDREYSIQSNLIHIIKKTPYNYDELFKLTLKSLDNHFIFDNNLFNIILQKCIKYDYIYKTDDVYYYMI
jgi:hypothetical protein